MVIQLKKIFIITALAIFSLLFTNTAFAASDDDESATEFIDEGAAEETQERVIPQYNAYYTDYFYAGDTYIKINIWIDSNTGGVTLTSSDYCDFVVEGYAEDNWSEKHYFDGKHDNTTYCQVYGGCYVTYQQITVVHVKVTASSYTGTGVYENTISLV